MFIKVMLGIILMGTLVGCSTTNKSVQVGHLQVRVANIESQLDEHDHDIGDLQTNLNDLSMRVKHITVARQQPSKASRTVKVLAPKTTTNTKKSENILRVPVAPQEVQDALKSAGYYQGSIDGKLGTQSKKAIKEFQLDHDLVSDGIVGKKTWDELKSYIE